MLSPRFCSCIAVLGICLGLVIGVSAQSPVPPTFKWDMTLTDVPPALAGMTFNVFDSRSELAIDYWFRNEGNEQRLVVPAEFLARLRVAMRIGPTPVPVDLVWREMIVNVAGDDVVAPVGVPVTLGPNEGFKASGVVRAHAQLAQGEHRLVTNVIDAVSTIRVANSMTPFVGRYVEEGQIIIRVGLATTTYDRRNYHLLEANLAVKRRDGQTAVRHGQELLKIDRADASGNYILGQAYVIVGQFSNAITEFERVIPALKGERSDVYSALAYAYLATGQDQKAEQTIAAQISNQQRRQEALDEMRADLRKRGVIR